MNDSASETVKKARYALAEGIKQFEIFKRSRSFALYHYVAALEGRSVLAVLKWSSTAPFAEHRVAVETSARVLETAYACCVEDDVTRVRFSAHAYKEAQALIEYAWKLDTIQYSFDLSEKGQFEIDVDAANSRIEFRYADSKADAADTPLRARELEMSLSGERGRSDRDRLTQAAERIYESLRQSVVVFEHESCTYKYGEALFDAIREYSAFRIQTVPEEMDADIAVDGFSFGDLRNFWGALLALSDAHTIAHWVPVREMNMRLPGRTLVFHKSQQELEKLTSQISCLPAETVRRLISLYQYDPGLPYRGPILQPLIPLNSSEICLPSLLLAGTNFERNFFKLLRRHPSLIEFADRVESQKEPIAIRSLTELFSGSLYRRRSGIKIPGITDIDFAVYELATGFMLLIQHKWLVPPETVNESSANDEHLAVGVRQAIDSREYANEHPGFLPSRLDLSKTEVITRVEAAVVCRGFEHSGFFDDKNIPVVMEVAFKKLLQESPDLPTFWQKLCARPDRDAAATKVIDLKRPISLAGYEFIVPTLGRIDN
jgi:hypothetical protein